MPLTVRGNVLSTLTRLQLLVQDGTAAAPSIAFTNRPQSGLYRAGAGAVGIAVDGVEIVRISSAGLASTYFTGNGSQLTGIGNLSVSNIQITDSGFIPIDDTAVSNSGGYLLVNGTGFTEPLGMLLGASIAPTSVTVVSQTQARVQVPSMPNGTYPLWVFTDTSSTIKNAALQVSPVPIWSTSTTLANVFKYTAFTQSLVATEGLSSNITYTLASGSSLPANVTLSSNGVLAGNILTDPGNTTAYSFVIDATDTQFQNIPRTFGLTALLAPITATGGTITYAGGYTIHTFTTSGTFTLTNYGNRPFEVLVVAGGGGGGSRHGGGGGGGGVLYNAAYTLPSGTHAVSVGSGGTGGKLDWNGSVFSVTRLSTNGSNSSIGSYVVALGGGSGGIGGQTGASIGGSGGGGTGPQIGALGTSGQGYPGGYGDSGNYSGGGGGGAGGNGGSGFSGDGGWGGLGAQYAITGTAVYYSGGGGGGGGTSGGGVGTNPSRVGAGGAGAGSTSTNDATSGTANTGGGGGGSGYGSTYYQGYGGNGGSGIVVIRYIP